MSPRSIRLVLGATALALALAVVWLSEGVVAAWREAAGPNRLEVPMWVERESIAEVFYDRGFGTRQEDAAQAPVGASTAGEPHLAVLAVPRVTVRGIRFDPIAEPGKFALGEPRWVTAAGRELARVPLTAIRPQAQIAELKRKDGRLEGRSTDGGNDPQLAFELTEPLPAGRPALPWGRAGGVAVLAVIFWRLRRRADLAGGWSAFADAVEKGCAASGRRARGLGAAIAGAGALWLLWPLHRTLDWPLWDEVNFAAIGAAWARHGGGLSDLHSGPLLIAMYGLWAKCVGLAAAIFLQHYVVKLGTTVLLYLVLARWWRSWPAAMAVALAWAATQFQTEFPLLVYQTAWLWFLAALVLVDRWPLAGLAGTVLAACVRQEYQFAAAILAGWLGWQVWRRRMAWRELVARGGTRGAVVAGGLIALAALAMVGGVLARTNFGHSDGRVWFAFQQHYAVRAVQTGEAPGLNPWFDYPQVMARDFPGAKSLGEAWRINAAAVGRHVWHNLRAAPGELAGLGAIHAGLGLAAGLLTAGALGLLLARRTAEPVKPRAVPASVVLAGAACVVVAPGLFVLAKGAYLLPLVPLAIGGAGGLAARGGGRGRWLAVMSSGLVVAGVVALVVAPRVFGPGTRSQAVAATVRRLEARWPEQGRAVLLGVSASSYAHYVGDERCVGVEPRAEASGAAGQSDSLENLLGRFAPVAVIVTAEWRSTAHFDEAQLSRLLAAPGWTKEIVPAGVIYWRAR